MKTKSQKAKKVARVARPTIGQVGFEELLRSREVLKAIDALIEYGADNKTLRRLVVQNGFYSGFYTELLKWFGAIKPCRKCTRGKDDDFECTVCDGDGYIVPDPEMY